MLCNLSIFLMVLMVCYSQDVDQTLCDDNEEYVKCPSLLQCQPSCDAPDGKPCPRICGTHPCQCRTGFVRDENLKCIPARSCHRQSTGSTSDVCGENEIWLACAPLQSCQASCEHPQGRICPRMCSLTPCVCQDGYVRVSKTNSTCIPRDQCATSSTLSSFECGQNEQFDSCANPCQSTCNNPDRAPCPTIRCSEGCICAPGYRRENDSPNSPCIACASL